MPQNKNQHFVPRFYLRRFAPSTSDRCINLLVISTGLTIQRAPIMGQASKSYFYGRDDEGYINWRELEARSAAIINEVVANGPPIHDSRAHVTMTIFIHLLHHRTQYAAAMYDELLDKMMKASLALNPRVDSRRLHESTFSSTDPMGASLMHAKETAFHLRDLQMRVLRNVTAVPFVSSDNPVVLYNQFLETRELRGGITGLMTKGLQLFVPLDPKHCLLYFDPFVYKVGTKLCGTVQICDPRDVLEMNRLQYLSAGKCVYFGDEMTQDNLRELVEHSRPYRRGTKVSVRTHKAVGPEGEVIDLLQMQACEIKCGLSLSFMRLQKRAKQYEVGPSLWHPRSQALDEYARAKWAARQLASRDRSHPSV